MSLWIQKFLHYLNLTGMHFWTTRRRYFDQIQNGDCMVWMVFYIFFNIGHSQNRIVALFLVFHMEMCRTSPLLTSCDILFWLKEMRGEMWQFSSGVMCFVDGQFIGDNEALITWAKDQWAFTCDEPEASCVDEYYLKHLQATRASLTSNHSHKYKQTGGDSCSKSKTFNNMNQLVKIGSESKAS